MGPYSGWFKRHINWFCLLKCEICTKKLLVCIFVKKSKVKTAGLSLCGYGKNKNAGLWRAQTIILKPGFCWLYAKKVLKNMLVYVCMEKAKVLVKLLVCINAEMSKTKVLICGEVGKSYWNWFYWFKCKNCTKETFCFMRGKSLSKNAGFWRARTIILKLVLLVYMRKL